MALPGLRVQLRRGLWEASVIRKLIIYLMSMVAGVFFLRTSEAFLRHNWWDFGWDLALVIGWSAVVWHHLSQMKETA